MMKKNVQVILRCLQGLARSGVSHGLSVMGEALVVGTPVMSATLQLTMTPETASAASVQATDLKAQVPGSVFDCSAI